MRAAELPLFETELLDAHLVPEAEHRELGDEETGTMKARVDSEGLSSYLRSLGGHPQLTRESEQALASRARRGDEDARQALAMSNLPFVVAVAKKYAHRGARLDDLIQEGNVGLMKAIEHFDPKKNVRFATYAVWWIRAYITRSLRDNRSQVRGGESERPVMADFSLDTPLDDDSDGSYMERLVDAAPAADSKLAQLEQNRDVSTALGRVHKRIGDLGWDIVQERLTQDKPRTLEELGERWGVSRERVRQVELKTKSFLQRYLEEFSPASDFDQRRAAA